MAYNNFTLLNVIEQFELNIVGVPFCENLPVVIPSEFFLTLFKEWFPLAQQAKSEKAKFQLLVSPILLEVKKLVNDSVQLFSSEEFNVEPPSETLCEREHGLNGFCDFLLSKSITPYVIQAPIVMFI